MKKSRKTHRKVEKEEFCFRLHPSTHCIDNYIFFKFWSGHLESIFQDDFRTSLRAKFCGALCTKGREICWLGKLLQSADYTSGAKNIERALYGTREYWSGWSLFVLSFSLLSIEGHHHSFCAPSNFWNEIPSEGDIYSSLRGTIVQTHQIALNITSASSEIFELDNNLEHLVYHYTLSSAKAKTYLGNIKFHL